MMVVPSRVLGSWALLAAIAGCAGTVASKSYGDASAGGTTGAGTGGVVATGGAVGTGGSSESGSGGRAPCVDTSSDPKNCGACYHECGATVLASDQPYPANIAVASGRVFWSTTGETVGTGSLVTVPIAGGTPVTLATKQEIAQIAADATHAYFTNVVTNAVMKVPVGGGAATVLASNQISPVALAIDETSVYWLTYSKPGCAEDDNSCGTIMKVSKAGGTPTTIASGQPHPTSIAVDATNVYWTTDSLNILKGAIWKAPVSGGAATSLASGQMGLRDDIRAGGGNVYFTAFTATIGFPALLKVPSAGGGSPTVVAPDISAFTTDDKNVYWIGVSATGMKMVPFAGGTATLVADGVGAGFVVDRRAAYWLVGDQLGKVMTLGATPCEAGQCRCPANQVLCFGMCLDAQTAAMRCGS